MAKKNETLRAEVCAAVAAEVQRTGPGFNKAALVAPFLGRGADRATVYRWVDAELASGLPAQAVAKRVKKAAAARAKRTTDPAKDAAKEAVAQLPKPVTPAEIAGRPTLNVFDRLQEVMARVEKVAKYAETPEGAIRNARLVLQSAETLRRCLDTSVRLAEAMNSLQRIEQFHEAVMQEIEGASPEMAERLVLRLGQLVARWGA